MKTILAVILMTLALTVFWGHVVPCLTLESRVNAELKDHQFVEALRHAELVYHSRPCLCSAVAERVIAGSVIEAIPRLTGDENHDFTQAATILLRYWNEVNTGEAVRLVRGLKERELQFVRNGQDPLRALAESNSAREFFDDAEFRAALDHEQPGLMLRIATVQIGKDRQEDALSTLRQVIGHRETSTAQWAMAQNLAAQASEGIARAAVVEKNYPKAFAAMNSLGNEFPGVKRIVDEFDAEVFGRSVDGAIALATPVAKSSNTSKVAELSIHNPSKGGVYTVVLRGPTAAEVDVPPGETTKVLVSPGAYAMAAFGDGRSYRTAFVANPGTYEQTIEPSQAGKGGGL
jgi:hypothetical protein